MPPSRPPAGAIPPPYEDGIASHDHFAAVGSHPPPPVPVAPAEAAASDGAAHSVPAAARHRGIHPDHLHERPPHRPEAEEGEVEAGAG